MGHQLQSWHDQSRAEGKHQRPESSSSKLNRDLHILQQQEAKYAGRAPLELLNQIHDHKQAIALTKQAIAGELSEAEWDMAVRPLWWTLTPAMPRSSLSMIWYFRY